MAASPPADVDEPLPEAAGPDAETLAGYFRVLGNPKRIDLLRFLARPRTIQAIATRLGVARQNAQEHVNELLDLGVVQRLPFRARDGPAAEYLAVPRRLFEIEEEFGRLGKVEVEDAFGLHFPTSALEDASGRSAGERDLPRLTIVRGARVGATSVLHGAGPWLVGREPQALVCLDYDPFASARHAEVRRSPSGFEVVDLYSRNGTSVEWSRLPRGGVAPLENGCVVQAGRTILLFRKAR